MKSARSRRVKRVIGIDPCSRGFGFAVVEDDGRLVDYAFVQVRPWRLEKMSVRLAMLVDRYAPVLLVVRQTAGQPQALRRRQIEACIIQLAAKRGLLVAAVSTDELKRRYGVLTLYAVAKSLADSMPELSPTLPEPRQPWTSQNAGLYPLLAAAAALAVVSSGRRLASTEEDN